MKIAYKTKWLNGIITPIFDVSLEPSGYDCAVAKRIIKLLEDRRDLFNSSEMEVPDHCSTSVIEIRGKRSNELVLLDDDTTSAKSLRAMHDAGHKF